MSDKHQWSEAEKLVLQKAVEILSGASVAGGVGSGGEDGCASTSGGGGSHQQVIRGRSATATEAAAPTVSGGLRTTPRLRSRQPGASEFMRYCSVK